MGWFLLAAAGNLTILWVVFILSTSPVSIPASESMGLLASLAEPMYAPELLLFTSIPGLLSGLRVNGASDSERDEAVRLIAWAVRVAFTFVLMFAVVVVWVSPQTVGTVLFALLLAFVTFVLAERLDPPVSTPIGLRHQKANQDLAAREFRATQSLGRGWHQHTTRWAWAIVAVFALSPVLLQTVLGAVIANVLWGPEVGFSPGLLAMLAMTALGPVILTFAWLAMADKAESIQARAWLGVATAALGMTASIAFASAFLFADDGSAPIGVLILAVTALQAAALWAPADWPGRRLLSRVAATLTSRHLERLAHAPVAAVATSGPDSPPQPPRE